MRLRVIILISIFLAAGISSYGQTDRASLTGTVSDEQKRVIVGATVTITNQATNFSRTQTSTDDGDFAISLIPIGNYKLEVSASNFKSESRIVELQVNQNVRLDIVLTVGMVGHVDIFRPPQPLLTKDSASLGTVINNRQITDLPLDGRNFLELSLLVPGTAPSASGSAGSVRGDFAFNVDGAREGANVFLLDGAYNVDPKLNGFGVRPPVDAIQEFNVQTNTTDASFGINPGAQVNIVLKSGGNDVHGTAYEFFRNGAMDARNFFAPGHEPAPRYQRNQFGFSLGGPIKKDRTFFFADYEGSRIREGITQVTNVPTLEERKGDFSHGIFPKPVNPFTGLPFNGDVIPQPFLNQIGLNIAALYPLPNRATPLQNFVSSPIERDRDDHFDARVDHHISSSSSLAFRYSFQDRSLFQPFSGSTFAAVPGYGVNVPQRNQNAMINHSYIFSPGFMNEARLAFNRISAGVFQQNQGTSINHVVGLPDISNDPRDTGLSLITITGYSPIGDEYNNPQHSATDTYQVSDNASYANGKELLTFGIDFRLTRQNAFRDVQARGMLTFSSFPAISENALADLLLGLPLLTGVARLDNPQHLRSRSYDFYVNQNYRLLPNLTITGGLRYEYNTPPFDASNRANVYDPISKSLVQVGTNGVPRGGYEPDRNNFAPRIGFAWEPKRDGRTVIRAGYGVYYDQAALAPGEGLYFNQPFFDFKLFFSLPGLPLTLNDPFPSGFPVQLPSSALAFQRDLRTGYLQSWNLNLQRQLGENRVLEIAYVGSKGTKLLTARDINQPQASPIIPNPRPNPQFDDINMLESAADSNYQSLQIRFQQRLTAGLSVLSAYTFSKSIDDASDFFSSAGDPNFPQDSLNRSLERGRSNFDLRHRFSLSYSYDLPFGRGRRGGPSNDLINTLVSGWQTNGIISLQTGQPFTVALLSSIDNSNTGRSILGFGANDRPNVSGNPVLSNPTPDQWFNVAAFSFPSFGIFGNAGRNILDGPGFQNVNVSLIKNTAIRESINIQFRAEFFNVFNRPNFNLPDNFVGSPTVGRISSAKDPRHIQFGLKLLF